MLMRKLFFVAAALLASPSAMSGMVIGHYVLWINLAKDPAALDKRLMNYLPKSNDACWTDYSALYGRTRPASLTNALVTKAILQKDSTAIGALSKILKQPFGAATAGFDGIIVYVEKPTPRMYGMTAGRRAIITEAVEEPDNEEYFGIAFCNMLPDQVRKP